MTHDEVIAWIDEQITSHRDLITVLEHKLENEVQAGDGWILKLKLRNSKIDLAQSLANRDVLVRHEASNGTKENWCLECYPNHYFPCPTYQEIYNRIREVM